MKRPALRILAALLLCLAVTVPGGLAQDSPGAEKGGVRLQGMEEQRARLPATVEQTYGPLLAPLNLSAGQLARVKELLAERIMARSAGAPTEPGGLPITEQKARVARAEAAVDRQMQALVEPAVFEKILALTRLESELGMIEYNYAPLMAEAGVPLEPAQREALAGIFKTTFSDVDNASAEKIDFAAIRSAATPEARARAKAPLQTYRDYRTRDVDPNTGLSAPDREIMRLAATFLSPGQLPVLQRKLAEVTRGWLNRAREQAPSK